MPFTWEIHHIHSIYFLTAVFTRCNFWLPDHISMHPMAHVVDLCSSSKFVEYYKQSIQQRKPSMHRSSHLPANEKLNFGIEYIKTVWIIWIVNGIRMRIIVKRCNSNNKLTLNGFLKAGFSIMPRTQRLPEFEATILYAWEQVKYSMNWLVRTIFSCSCGYSLELLLFIIRNNQEFFDNSMLIRQYLVM